MFNKQAYNDADIKLMKKWLEEHSAYLIDKYGEIPLKIKHKIDTIRNVIKQHNNKPIEQLKLFE